MRRPGPVSYTHLDVYKRQLHSQGVQATALGDLCPAVTLECGKVGGKQGVSHALEYIDACLHLSDLPRHPVAPQDIDLYHTCLLYTSRCV